MRSIRYNKKAAGFLGAVIVLIAVLMATIIGAVVFFAFSSSTTVTQLKTESFTRTGANNKAFYFALTGHPDSSPEWNITMDASGTSYYPASSANYTYLAGNNTLKLNAGTYNTGNSSVVIIFYTQAKTAVASVATNAVMMFAMMAIVPLIIVGGLMLKSLGFMGGGKEV